MFHVDSHSDKPQARPDVLDGVKKGDTLLVTAISRWGKASKVTERLMVVSKVTPKFVTCGSVEFTKRYGHKKTGISDCNARLATPEDIQRVRNLEAVERQARLEQQQQEEAKKARPEWQAADFLSGLASMTTDEILARYGAAKCLQAAAILQGQLSITD